MTSDRLSKALGRKGFKWGSRRSPPHLSDRPPHRRTRYALRLLLADERANRSKDQSGVCFIESIKDLPEVDAVFLVEERCSNGQQYSFARRKRAIVQHPSERDL